MAHFLKSDNVRIGGTHIGGQLLDPLAIKTLQKPTWHCS
jgi:hypothetical protein